MPEILQELEPYTGELPMKAMREAIEHREAITPELLRVLSAVAENPEKYARREDHMLHLFALDLVAQAQLSLRRCRYSPKDTKS